MKAVEGKGGEWGGLIALGDEKNLEDNGGMVD